MKTLLRCFIVCNLFFAGITHSQVVTVYSPTHKEPPTETEIADYNFAKDTLGFPRIYMYKGEEKTEYFPLKLKLSDSESTALQWYNSGLLDESNREETIRSAIHNNIQEIQSTPNSEFGSFSEFKQDCIENKVSCDTGELIAAFYMAQKYGIIDDILSFLRFSVFYTLSISTEVTPLVVDAHSPAWDSPPPEQQLMFYPAAYAIFSHPQKTIPMLLKVIPDKSVSHDLRIRAAAFINTINPNLIDDALVRSCDEGFAATLLQIINEDFLWCDSAIILTETYKEKNKMHWEDYKKRWNIPNEEDIEKSLRKSKLENWSFLRVDYDPYKQ